MTLQAESRVRIEDDFHGWLLHQSSVLRARRTDLLEWDNVAEELEEMAALQRDKIVGLLRVLLVHLLKWRYSRVRRSEPSWRRSIVVARVDVGDLLEDSQTLRNELPELLAKAYRGARKVAGSQMNLAKDVSQRLFPEVCPWDADLVLNDDFLPEIAPEADGRS